MNEKGARVMVDGGVRTRISTYACLMYIIHLYDIGMMYRYIVW